jgi:hypothetical protein
MRTVCRVRVRGLRDYLFLEFSLDIFEATAAGP